MKKVLSLLFIIIFTNAYASKIDVMVGMYSFTGEASSKKSTFSGFGTYEAAYLHPFLSHFEANIGYSFTMTSVVGGDYSYGPKLGINYYPLNFSSNEKINLPNKTINVQDFYRPYIGIAFNQRQYQSVKTSYAGFGVALGLEKFINPNYTMKTELKLNSYTAASDATASEINLLVGLVFGF